ncbi:MAG: hypothetical protein HKO10_05310 [Acidimicrobiia bacterium]|nr:hypothetical protein [Acidimicrobiia bacterium]
MGSDVTTFMYEDRAVEYSGSDSVLVALLRAGERPSAGGTLCLSGDCPFCLCTVDGFAYVRACQTPANTGQDVWPHPADGDPPLPAARLSSTVELITVHTEVVVIGQGSSGREAGESYEVAGRSVMAFEASRGEEAVGIYPGPLVMVRTPEALLAVHCDEVVAATGASEMQPVVPGNLLAGLYTSRAVEELHGAGVELGLIVAVGRPPSGVPHQPVSGELVRFEGDADVEAVVMQTDSGEVRWACDAVSLGLGLYPRDVLSRMAGDLAVTTVGDAATVPALPPFPDMGVVCPCAKVDVDQLEDVFERGFTEMELVKRATLAGTGTCQGQSCMPHLRSFLKHRTGSDPVPFTARPLAKQMTVREAISNFQTPGFFRTALDEVHRSSGGVMDRFGPWFRPWHYGDPLAEYEAVRNGVSIMDVSTLGKITVTGPDVAEFLERIYPTKVSHIRPGRSKYVLMLNEKGTVIDDGMVCRDSEHRFTLTFTSSGVSFAEMWMRDWAEAWGMDVRILNRTASLGAINVTGPQAKRLMEMVGAEDLPSFMEHRRMEVADVPGHVFRLSFTGEISYEIHHAIDRSVELWNTLLEAGKALDVRPHGLEALLTLRLEKGHIIVGQDTEADSTARRLRHDWAVNLDKNDFLGRQAVVRTNDIALDRQLIGMTTDGPAPEEGTVLYDRSGLSGYITSARYSPTLSKTVMLGWVRLANGTLPESLRADDRPVEIVSTPFFDPEGTRARA